MGLKVRIVEANGRSTRGEGVGPEVGYRVAGLGGGAGGGQEDEVGCLGVGFQEVVDEAFADGEADST